MPAAKAEVPKNASANAMFMLLGCTVGTVALGHHTNTRLERQNGHAVRMT